MRIKDIKDAAYVAWPCRPLTDLEQWCRDWAITRVRMTEKPASMGASLGVRAYAQPEDGAISWQVKGTCGRTLAKGEMQ
jgi:hypothetical protein